MVALVSLLLVMLACSVQVQRDTEWDATNEAAQTSMAATWTAAAPRGASLLVARPQAQVCPTLALPDPIYCVAVTATPGPIGTAAPTPSPSKTATPRPPVITPTPVQTLATAAATPLPSAIPCAWWGKGAEPAKGGSYVFTDPQGTGLTRQNVRNGPGLAYVVVGQISKGAVNSIYWKVDNWLALNYECTRWVAVLGDYRESN